MSTYYAIEEVNGRPVVAVLSRTPEGAIGYGEISLQEAPAWVADAQVGKTYNEDGTEVTGNIDDDEYHLVGLGRGWHAEEGHVPHEGLDQMHGVGGHHVPKGRTRSDEEIRQHIAEHAAKELIGFTYMPPETDVHDWSIGDRIALITQPPTVFTQSHWSSKDPETIPYQTAINQLGRDAKANGWSNAKVLEEGQARGLLSRTQTEVFSKAPTWSRVTTPELLSGLNAKERDEMETALIPALTLPRGAGGAYGPYGLNAESLSKAGWTVHELERFADKVDDAGADPAHHQEGHIDASDLRPIDSLAENLGFFSRKYDTFLANAYRGWALASGTPDAFTLREIVDAAFPHQGTFFQPKRDEYWRAPVTKGFFSPRAVAHVQRLKGETEAYYKRKLGTDDLTTVPLPVMRAIGGHVQAYTPSSVESWTADARTVPRFEKMMERDGKSTALKTTVTYADVLWSHQTAKGHVGWPDEGELKGKKEFVILGNGIHAVQSEPHRVDRYGVHP